jgi:transposase
MTKRTRQRLGQIVGRDSRAIRSLLGVIEYNKERLLTGVGRNSIDITALHRLTMTALVVKVGEQQRPSVPHDLKAKFPRMSQNELAECRATAAGLYDSYLRIPKWMRRSKPCANNASGRIPRWIFSQRFKLLRSPSTRTRWWVSLRDSLDTLKQHRHIHDRLLIPLKVSPFHLTQLRRGQVKALQILTDQNRKWWITFAVRLPQREPVSTNLPPAVLGIDLGIKKAACTALVTPEKVRETRYFVQKDRAHAIEKYNQLVANLQQERDKRPSDGCRRDGVTARLGSMRTKRENVSQDHDKVLVRQLLDYISALSQKHDLYVAIGKLKYIRATAQRVNCRGHTFRASINSWAFSRVTKSLKHGLAQMGWQVDSSRSHFRAVPESWTSILCWKCGAKGLRPRQNYFVCPTCGQKTNADRNGAINIAGRLIMVTDSLHSVTGHGKWASAATATRRTQLKARGRKSSRGRSLLPTKDAVSHSGESAVVHIAKMSLPDFSDEIRLSDHDPAVVKTVERLSAAGHDTPAPRQEKEARSEGGTLSR